MPLAFKSMQSVRSLIIIGDGREYMTSLGGYLHGWTCFYTANKIPPLESMQSVRSLIIIGDGREYMTSLGGYLHGWTYFYTANKIPPLGSMQSVQSLIIIGDRFDHSSVWFYHVIAPSMN